LSRCPRQRRDRSIAATAAPSRSRHAIATRLRVVADRLGLPFDAKDMIEGLIRQIEDWRQAEPVILACAGKVNA
jgi:hypothetical protein